MAVGYREDGIKIYNISSGIRGGMDGLAPLERRYLLPHFFFQMSVYTFIFLGSQETQRQVLNVAVSALVWLSPSVLVSGAEDGSLRGWMIKGRSLYSLWLLSRHQKPVLGLATSQELLASASGMAEQCYRIISLKYADVTLQFITSCTCSSKPMRVQFLFTAFKMLLNVFILHSYSRLFLERVEKRRRGSAELPRSSGNKRCYPHRW